MLKTDGAGWWNQIDQPGVFASTRPAGRARAGTNLAALGERTNNQRTIMRRSGRASARFAAPRPTGSLGVKRRGGARTPPGAPSSSRYAIQEWRHAPCSPFSSSARFWARPPHNLDATVWALTHATALRKRVPAQALGPPPVAATVSTPRRHQSLSAARTLRTTSMVATTLRESMASTTTIGASMVSALTRLSG